MNFKKWLLSEMANFGFEKDFKGKPKGGTDEIKGNEIFNTIDGGRIITELVKLPALGSNVPYQKWNDMVEWGSGPGAIQVSVTPLGSMKIIIRRNIKDLLGESIWICNKIIPLDDNKDENHEVSVANDVYDQVVEISREMLPTPDQEYNIEKLSWDMWMNAKRNHPSYCMFPVALKKQNENYFKMVFEFRGHGVLRQKSGRPGRAEQFDIDVIWDKNKGTIRVMGYNIDSTLSQHSWRISPSEFNEYFSPRQTHDEIIDCVIKMFLQY